ncbi:MAG: hypothetical protein Q8Q06_00925 [bacterium]|nr:hypothetical protein [bacterium]
MPEHKKIIYDLNFALAVILIIIGFVALITPFTPGAWLILIGLVWIFGKDRSRHIVEKILGPKISKKLKIEEIFSKLFK